MFSQTKQAPPTIKMVIKSKLPTDKDKVEVDNTNTSTIEIKSTAKISEVDPHSQKPTVPESTATTITNNISAENNLDKKRKRNEKDNFSLASKKVNIYVYVCIIINI